MLHRISGPAATVRIAGVVVRLHLASAVVVAIALWGITADSAEGRADHARNAGIVLAALLALLLLHLILRILVYRAVGTSVDSVGLFLFGGAIDPQDETCSPWREAFAGAVGLLFATFAAVVVVDGRTRFPFIPAPSTTLGGALRVGFVGFALLQALPALPLDAGRLLRALAWTWSESAVVSQRVAAGGSQLVAASMLGYGLFLLSLESGRPFWGLIIAVAGLQASLSSVESLRTSRWLRESREMTLADAGFSSAGTIFGDLLIVDVIDRLRSSGDHTATIVVNALNEPVAVVRWGDLRHARRAEWDVRTIGAIATPLTEMATLPSGMTIQEAVSCLEGSGQAVGLVTEQGRIVAAVTRDRLLGPPGSNRR